jgi:hypothetical protein
MGPEGQILTVASWHSIKESALLLGVLAKKIPLPTINDKHV